MTNDYVWVANASDNSFDLLDKSDGSIVDTLSYSTATRSVQTDFNGNVYLGFSEKFVKLDSGFNEQWSFAPNGDVGYILLSPDQQYVYIGAGSRILKCDVDTGDEIWLNYNSSNSIGDITFGPSGDIYYTASFHESVFRVDSDTGNTVGSWDVGDSYDNIEGITWINGNFFALSEDSKDGVLKYDDWKGTKVNSYSVSGHSNIERHYDGTFYVGDTGGGVYKLDSNLNELWSSQVGTVEYISTISITPSHEVFVGSRYDGEVFKFDGETGTQLWGQSNVGVDNDCQISAWPTYDTYGDGSWFPSVTVSGTANLQGSGVEGADILVIDDDRNVVADRVQTDSSGNWSTDVRDNTLHILAQYTDADGNVYNTESYPYVNSN